MLRTVLYRSGVAVILSSGIALGVAGTAFAAPVTIDSLKKSGWECSHSATNMTTCSKTGAKDYTCSESEDKCEQLLIVTTSGRAGQLRNPAPLQARQWPRRYCTTRSAPPGLIFLLREDRAPPPRLLP